MPILATYQLNAPGIWGIWEIRESTGALREGLLLSADDEERLETMMHEQRKRQFLASRRLLQELTGQAAYVGYSSAGKPFLKNTQDSISFSHSGDYAAAAISSMAVGVDIEYKGRKTDAIAPRFLSEPERHMMGHAAPDILTWAWCAKEAAYKWYGHGGLDFRKDISLMTCPDKDGYFSMRLHGNGEEMLTGRCHRFEKFLLVYVVNN